MDLSLAVTGIAWFLGGFAVMATGMGGPLLVLPLMAPFTPLPVIILVSCFVSVPNNALLCWRFFRAIDWKKAWIMTIASMPGAWAGVLVLTHVPVFWLELGLGLLLLCFVIWQWRCGGHDGREVQGGAPGLAAWGAASGFCSGAVGMGGPPLAICAYSRRWEKDMARGVFGVIFLVSISFAVVLDLWHGLVTDEAWRHILVAVPASLAGTMAGLPAASRISQPLFRRFMLLVVLAGALTLIGKAFR